MRNRRPLLPIASSLLLCCASFVQVAFVQAQSGRVARKKVTIVSPALPATKSMVATGNFVLMEFNVTDPEVTYVKIRVTTKTGDAGSFVVTMIPGQTRYPRYVPLFRGDNKIELFAAKGDAADSSSSDSLSVECNDPRCFRTLPDIGKPDSEAGDKGEPNQSFVVIKQPAGDVTEGTVNALISVAKKSEIKKLNIAVYDKDENRVDYKPAVDVIDWDANLGLATATLKVAEGANTIRVFDPLKRADATHQALAIVTCAGEKCGKGQAADADGGGGKKSEITILKPAANDAANEGVLDAVLSVSKDSDIKKLEYEILYTTPDGTKRDSGEVVKVLDHPGKAGVVIVPKIHVRSGENTIRFFDPDKSDKPEKQASIKVTCADGKCFSGPSAAEAKSDITIDQPKVKPGEKYSTKNTSSLDAYVSLAKESTIQAIQYDVIHDGKVIFTSEPEPVTAGNQKKITLRFVRGDNTIRIYDVAHPGGDNDTAIDINCAGDNCASDLDVASIVTNSQNTRVVVGLEQAGGSSAESKTKPFLDFFFTTPFWYDKNPTKLVQIQARDKDGNLSFDEHNNPVMVWVQRPDRTAPRLGFWGQVRLTSSPEQLTTTGVFPSTLANQVAQSGRTTNLVQSFDFLAGMEGRVRTANGSFLSLIPGIRQRTSFFLAGGYGAVSPLDATKENTQFFVLPPANSPQRALFEERFGKPPQVIIMGQPTDPTVVAFVPLERDRFFRQWYAGIRLKTNYCEDDSCDHFRNSFPAITDFMIGQSQSVTGGTFKRTTKEGKSRQAFVFRVDAFYPLPFRETRFIYLYGTALMKIGGDVRVDSALLLEPATSIPSINSPTVYIPPVDFLRAQQPNRDYYKIGIGINLTDFFNRNKPR